jgi:regulator of protease activity HflC (stomatin/prohibitin superfamily)
MSTKQKEKTDEGEGKGSGGIFGGLKNLLFEDDGKDEGDKPEPVPKASNGGHAVSTAPPPPMISYGATAPDPAIRAILEKDVQAAAAPALTALDQMCTNLASAIPDEGMRIKAGLAAIQTQHTFAAVMTDVDECLQALDKKSSENATAVQAAIQKRVGAREAAIAEIDTSIAQKKAEIARLTSEIAETEGRKAAETAAIATERAEIDRTNAKFNATVAAFRADLEAKKQKIATYGKGA